MIKDIDNSNLNLNILNSVILNSDININTKITEDNNIDINIGIDVDGTLTKEIVGKDILELSFPEVEKAMLGCSPKDGFEILIGDNYNIRDYKIYVITGRKERFRRATSEWLKMYGIPYDELIMFPNDFYIKNGYSIPKYVNLKVDIHIRKKICFALDDKEEVINALNNSGISACRVTNNFREAFEKVLEFKEGKKRLNYGR